MGQPWSVFEHKKRPKPTSKRRTDLKNCVPETKFVKESDSDVKTSPAPPKSIENCETCDSEPIYFVDFFFFFGVEKSKVANHLKRVFPKFEADRSHVRGVNGRSKFDVASAGFAKRKQFWGPWTYLKMD